MNIILPVVSRNSSFLASLRISDTRFTYGSARIRGMPLRAFITANRPYRSIYLACAGLLSLIPFFMGILTMNAQDGSSSRGQTKAQPGIQNLVIAPNLMEELAKFKPVRMPFDSTHLTARERQMVGKLVEACQDLESIYWRQSDPEGLNLYHALAGSRAPKDIALRRFLRINGSRFDLINNDAPFVGTAPRPPGRGFFPPI